MLFYVKKSLWLDLLVTALLAASGAWGIGHFHLPVHAELTWVACVQGLTGALLIAAWTLLLQKGYAVVRGEEYARRLTESLAQHYAGASLPQAIGGGLTAALGEELFFRGFIQMQWGILASSLAFGLAHFGGRDIRVVSYWSFVHGLLFALVYRATGNLAVPMIAHGLFDLGGVLYFQRLMRPQTA